MQTINLGNIVNDGTGDDLRTAFEKVNNNFYELTQTYGSVTTGANVGESGEGIFKDKTGSTLNFKKINGGTGIKITAVNGIINITVDPVADITVNSIDVTSMIYGNVTGNLNGTVIGTIYSTETNDVVAYGNIVGVNGVITNVSDPNYSPARVDGISIQDLNRQVNTFNFGSIINQVYFDPLSYLLSQVGADMGSITAPAVFSIDAGSFI